MTDADGADWPPDRITTKSYAERVFRATGSSYDSKEVKVSNKEALQRQLDEALKRLAQYDIFPDEDPFDVGNVLYFEVQFLGQEKVYAYVSIKCEDNAWAITGYSQRIKLYTWSELVDFMSSRKVKFVQKATSWETVFGEVEKTSSKWAVTVDEGYVVSENLKTPVPTNDYPNPKGE